MVSRRMRSPVPWQPVYAIDAEQKLDGKFLLRCSDPKLSAEDIGLGYKQLLEVGRRWRDA